MNYSLLRCHRATHAYFQQQNTVMCLTTLSNLTDYVKKQHNEKDSSLTKVSTNIFLNFL